MENVSDFKKQLDDFFQSDDKKKLVSNIKRLYTINKKNSRSTGELEESDVDYLVEKLLDNYEELKGYKEINEILESAIDDYKYVRDDENSERIDKKIKNVHTNILGNPGAHSEGLILETINDNSNEKVSSAYSYLEDVIKGKLQDENEILINRDDVLNILIEQSNLSYGHDLRQYQTFINNVVMGDINLHQEKLTNPKMVNVLLALGNTYKAQDKQKESIEIYKKALELYQTLKCNDSELRSSLEENLAKVQEIQSIKDDVLKLLGEDTSNITEVFLNINADSYDEMLRKLNGYAKEDYVDRDNEGTPYTTNPSDVVTDQKQYEVMPFQDKLKGIQGAINNLGLTIDEIYTYKSLKDDPNNQTLQSFASIDGSYDKYLLIKLVEGNMSILESFDPDAHKSLLIIPTENLEEILRFQKVKDQVISGARKVYHYQGTSGENPKKGKFQTILERKLSDYIAEKQYAELEKISKPMSLEELDIDSLRALARHYDHLLDFAYSQFEKAQDDTLEKRECEAKLEKAFKDCEVMDNLIAKKENEGKGVKDE